MGLFKKTNSILSVACPVKGRALPMSRVPDVTFSDHILGKGMAIAPMEGKVFAPFDGMVDMIFDTGHAVNLVSEDGVEVLIHVGIDTVTLKGKYFTPHVENGTKIHKGDLLIEFDLSAILSAGYSMITPVVICNTNDYKEIQTVEDIGVAVGDTIIKIYK